MKGLSNNPQHIDDHNWYYEEPGSIHFVHEVLNDKGALIQTDTVRIPWRPLERSRARLRKAKAADTPPQQKE